MAQPNPFDQFDAAPAASTKNPFDQFDFGSYPSVIGREAAKGATDVAGQTLKGLSLLLDPGVGEAATASTVDTARELARTPVKERPIYQAGESVQQFGQKHFPTTTAEDTSITGQASRMAGGIAPLVAGGLVAPEVAVPLGAGVFASSSAGQTFDEAKAHGASDEDAAKAAGLSGLVGGALGVLPLGAVLSPVRRVAPGLVGWAATKLAQAAKSGIVFTSVGEAQNYIEQEIAKDYYDPTAHYSPDAKRMMASFIGGGVLGAVHPEAPPRQSTPEEIADFVRQSQSAPGAQQPFSQTAADINEFTRRRDAGWTYDDATGQWSPPQAGSGLPRLPPPSEPGQTAPAAEPAPPGAPPPEATPAPSAGGAIDHTYPTFEEPGRTAPNVFDQFDGQQAAEAPQVQQQPSTAAVPAEEPAKPAPPANGGRATLEALLNDPRSAVEIQAAMDAARANDEAIAARAAADAQAGGGQMADTLVPDQPPVNPVPHETSEPIGTRQAPVTIEQPADVLAGAERTGTPTPAQAEAGNYSKRHVRWNGLNIAVETEAGQDRKGTGPDGSPWAVTLLHPYGYIKGTTGRDGDQVDVYLGPEPQSPHVYIVDQIDPATGAFDEHKALLGYPDEASARAAYVAGFSDNLGNARLGALRATSVAEFKTWLSKGQRRAPVAYSDPVASARAIARDHGLNATDDEITAAVHAHRVNNADLKDAVFGAVERSALAERDSVIETARKDGLGDAWTTDTTAADETGAGSAAPGEQPAGPQAAAAGELAPAREQPGEAQPGPIAVEPPAPPKPAKNIPQNISEPSTKKGWREIGKNTEGRTLYEDERGVRSYVENGVRVTEAVPIKPTRAGVQIEPPVYKDEWLTASEKQAELSEAEWRASNPPFRVESFKEFLARTRKPEPSITSSDMTVKTLNAIIDLKPQLAKQTAAQREQMRKWVDDQLAAMADQGKKIAEHCLETGGKFSVR